MGAGLHAEGVFCFFLLAAFILFGSHPSTRSQYPQRFHTRRRGDGPVRAHRPPGPVSATTARPVPSLLLAVSCRPPCGPPSVLGNKWFLLELAASMAGHALPPRPSFTVCAVCAVCTPRVCVHARRAVHISWNFLWSSIVLSSFTQCNCFGASGPTNVSRGLCPISGGGYHMRGKGLWAPGLSPTGPPHVHGLSLPRTPGRHCQELCPSRSTGPRVPPGPAASHPVLTPLVPSPATPQAPPATHCLLRLSSPSSCCCPACPPERAVGPLCTRWCPRSHKTQDPCSCVHWEKPRAAVGLGVTPASSTLDSDSEIPGSPRRAASCPVRLPSGRVVGAAPPPCVPASTPNVDSS